MCNPRGDTNKNVLEFSCVLPQHSFKLIPLRQTGVASQLQMYFVSLTLVSRFFILAPNNVYN